MPENTLYYGDNLDILTAAPSVGSLISSLALAFLGNSQRKGTILMVNGLLVGVALIAFGNLRTFPLILLFLGLLGAARNATMVTNNMLIQVSCDVEFRGRTMAMYMMLIGLMPLCTIPSAALAQKRGGRRSRAPRDEVSVSSEATESISNL
jgi:hypothetical protein